MFDFVVNYDIFSIQIIRNLVVTHNYHQLNSMTRFYEDTPKF